MLKFVKSTIRKVSRKLSDGSLHHIYIYQVCQRVRLLPGRSPDHQFTVPALQTQHKTFLHFTLLTRAILIWWSEILNIIFIVLRASLALSDLYIKSESMYLLS